MTGRIRISNRVLAALLDCARAEPQAECCGLLGGREDLITRVFPATNTADNIATAYEIAPAELFRLMREIRSAGLELTGIYHSHPNGSNEPSPRDIARAYYPKLAYCIISPRASSAAVRAFAIRDGRVCELKIEELVGP